MITGIHHIQLATPPGREDELRAFYCGRLGMTEVAKPEELAKRGGAWFRGGGAELHLGVEEDFRPAGKAHPGLLVRDLDEVLARFPEAEVDPWLPGYLRCYVDDPVGNRLELLQPVSR
ncbi:VOC family protein [Herbidospora cretacea]|uniref:VOC family protein n=1 Tax=Herbidospora cretacea TaxID=28444 RepID=UPI000772E9C2|nr:VOC family protein [Herbidospora cretacea]